MSKGKIISLSVVIFLLFSSLTLYNLFKIYYLQYYIIEQRKDIFIINTIHSIVDLGTFNKSSEMDLKPSDASWKKFISKHFVIIKDSGFSYTEYYIKFDTNFILYIDVGESSIDIFGRKKFRINAIGESGGEFVFNPTNSARFYYIGPYKIYSQ